MVRFVPLFAALAAVGLAASLSLAADPYADEVISYIPGSGAEPGYNNPATALGAPERFSGEGIFPGVVSVFSSAWRPDELVSFGNGGSLTVRFDEPVVDDPSHLYGVDLIIFGNSGFITDTGNVVNPALLYGGGQGRIEVSADGITFYEIPNIFADGLFPAQGYLDSGPFDDVPGTVPTNFQKPVNPALTLADFSGLTYAQVLALYDGSGGGLPVDLSLAVDANNQPANLSSISYVRISHVGSGSTEIEAFVAVPEPAASLLLLGGLVLMGRRIGSAGRFG